VTTLNQLVVLLKSVEVRIKVSVHVMKAYGGVAVHFHTFLTSVLDTRVFNHFTPDKKIIYLLKRVLCGPKSRRGGFETVNYFSPRKLSRDSSIVEPVFSPGTELCVKPITCFFHSKLLIFRW